MQAELILQGLGNRLAIGSSGTPQAFLDLEVPDSIVFSFLFSFC